MPCRRRRAVSRPSRCSPGRWCWRPGRLAGPVHDRLLLRLLPSRPRPAAAGAPAGAPGPVVGLLVGLLGRRDRPRDGVEHDLRVVVVGADERGHEVHRRDLLLLGLHREGRQAGQGLLRDVGAEHALGGLGDVGEVQHDRLRVELVDHRGDDAALARHPLVVRGVGAAAGVPEGVVAVEVAVAGLDPALDLVLRADRGAPLHGDVEPADRVDQAAEALEVDEHEVLDVQPGERLHGLGGGQQPGVLGAGGELLAVVGAPRVERVEQALVAAGPALRHQPGHDRPGPEPDVLGLAREAEEHRPAALGVDAGELDAVRPQPDAAGAAVAAEQEDVVAAVDRTGRLRRWRTPRSSRCGRRRRWSRRRRPRRAAPAAGRAAAPAPRGGRGVAAGRAGRAARRRRTAPPRAPPSRAARLGRRAGSSGGSAR